MTICGLRSTDFALPCREPLGHDQGPAPTYHRDANGNRWTNGSMVEETDLGGPAVPDYAWQHEQAMHVDHAASTVARCCLEQITGMIEYGMDRDHPFVKELDRFTNTVLAAQAGARRIIIEADVRNQRS